MTALLEITGLTAGYGDVPVLEDVSLVVPEGEVVSVVGPNGAGKTTLLSTISGVIRATEGRIVFEGRDITGASAAEIVEAGLIMVPEGRRLFPFLTVRENLQLGAYHRAARRELDATLADMLELFPVLAERQDQFAGSLSGGEQQMCALARGMMAKPRLLMLDEPSLGLSPRLVEIVFSRVADLAARGLTVLLVEQNVGEALEMSSHAYVLEQGRIGMSGEARAILEDPRVRDSYLGV